MGYALRSFGFESFRRRSIPLQGSPDTVLALHKGEVIFEEGKFGGWSSSGLQITDQVNPPPADARPPLLTGFPETLSSRHECDPD
jgi:hypothetical protein